MNELLTNGVFAMDTSFHLKSHRFLSLISSQKLEGSAIHCFEKLPDTLSDNALYSRDLTCKMITRTDDGVTASTTTIHQAV